MFTECSAVSCCPPDFGSYHEQLQRDSQFLCADRRMDAELVDRLVLQLNRIHPQVLSDKEAHRVAAARTSSSCLTVGCFVQGMNAAPVSPQFRNLSVPTEVRLAELLTHLQWEGEDACYEFYRGLHIHAEHVYLCLPSRVRQRGTARRGLGVR